MRLPPTIRLALALLLGPVGVAIGQSPAKPLSLWYTSPAVRWVEALPVGNGRLGAMVFGGTAR
jgi:alpha-L-fucosidase 2